MKKYSRKQITEAIAYWKKQLDESSNLAENDIGVTYQFFWNFRLDMLDSQQRYQFRNLMTQIDQHEQTMNDFQMVVPDRSKTKKSFSCLCLTGAFDTNMNLVGVCIGSPGLCFIPNCVDIEYCVVDDAYRGKHLGKEIVDEFCKNVRDRITNANITLCVNCNNPRAQHVYEENGFKPFMLMMLNQNNI